MAPLPEDYRQTSRDCRPRQAADSLPTRREKLAAVARILSPSERERFATLAPSVLDAVEAQEPDVIEAIARLAELSPEIIALWLQLHIRSIEARFAS